MPRSHSRRVGGGVDLVVLVGKSRREKVKEEDEDWVGFKSIAQWCNCEQACKIVLTVYIQMGYIDWCCQTRQQRDRVGGEEGLWLHRRRVRTCQKKEK